MSQLKGKLEYILNCRETKVECIRLNGKVLKQSMEGNVQCKMLILQKKWTVLNRLRTITLTPVLFSFPSDWIILEGYVSQPDRFSKPRHVCFEFRHYNQLRWIPRTSGNQAGIQLRKYHFKH